MAAPHNDNVKNKILEAASSILEQKSFNEISLAEIAEATGVSKGTIYYYYKNKDMILADVADGYFQDLYDELKEWVYNESKDTSLPRVLSFVVNRAIDDEKKSLRFHLLVEAIGGNEYVRNILIERYQDFKNIFGDVVSARRKDGDEYYYGWLIMTIIDGIMVQTLLKNNNLDKNLFLEKLIESLKKN